MVNGGGSKNGGDGSALGRKIALARNFKEFRKVLRAMRKCKAVASQELDRQPVVTSQKTGVFEKK